MSITDAQIATIIAGDYETPPTPERVRCVCGCLDRPDENGRFDPCDRAIAWMEQRVEEAER